MSAQLCFSVSFLEAWESPSHYFFRSETARPQIGLWQKIRGNPKYLVVFFTIATPNTNHWVGWNVVHSHCFQLHMFQATAVCFLEQFNFVKVFAVN
jgi:hypothetical protein